MENVQTVIAKDLLKIKAVFFRPWEPFTWASGIKSPVYCDNRLTLTAPEVRNDVENALADVIREKYPDVEVLMGTSTAGIAHAAIVGHILGLPMGYVRSGKKDHGRQNQIEGRLEPGQKVVVVEDLISTGGSCIEVVNILREAGARSWASSASSPTACRRAWTGSRRPRWRTPASPTSTTSPKWPPRRAISSPPTSKDSFNSATTRLMKAGSEVTNEKHHRYSGPLRGGAG